MSTLVNIVHSLGQLSGFARLTMAVAIGQGGSHPRSDLRARAAEDAHQYTTRIGAQRHEDIKHCVGR